MMREERVPKLLVLTAAAVVVAALATWGFTDATPASPLRQRVTAVSTEDATSTGRFSSRSAEEKLHPLLRRWLVERSPDETEPLLVTFRDDVIVPPLTGEAVPAEQAIEELEAERARDYVQLVEELRDQHGAVVVETFWLVKAVLVHMPLGNVLDLAARPDIVFIQPQHTGEPPP